jgi:hypothetical protein
MLTSNAPMAVEMKNLSLVFALLVVYLVLFVPYVVRVKVDQMAQVIIFFWSGDQQCRCP